MTYKRKIKTSILSRLRGFGLLCKKKQAPRYNLRLASTVYPEYTTSPIDAERHVWAETKKSGRKNCQFNTETMSCQCGVETIEEFNTGCRTTYFW